MRKTYGIALLFLLAISFSSFAEEKEKLTDKAKKMTIQVKPETRQEYVTVRGNALSADLTQQPLADKLADYQSKDTRELVSPLDLLQFHSMVDWNRSFAGHPFKSQNFVEVKEKQ